MAKLDQTILMLALVAIGLLSIAGASHAPKAAKNNHFTVEGMVYCDTCRVQFITRVSQVLEGATVELECRNLTTSKVSFGAQAKTDKLGLYSFNVNGDHEDDICEVELISSPKADCSEITSDVLARQAAMISLTSNNGEATNVRYANPLGFLKNDPLPECPEVLKELDMDEDADGEGAGVGNEEVGHETGAPHK